MRILRVSIKNYKSIINLNKLSLEGSPVVFVGANEHGKSNILKALSLLNPSNKLSIDDARRDQNSKTYFPFIEFELSLNGSDRQRVAEILNSKTPEGSEQDENKHSENSDLGYVNKIPETVSYRRYMEKSESDSASEFYFIKFDKRSPEVADAIYSYLQEAASKKVIYFDEFNSRLGSKVTQDEVNDTSNFIVSGLLKISGLEEVRDSLFTDTPSVRHLLQKANEKATNDIRIAWRQGKDDDISVTITRGSDDNSILVDVQDRNTFINLGSRSRGFQWFLSFYLNYRAYHDGAIESSDSIFLIDEPGIFLHPLGQKDLLSYLEQLGDKNQVIYSTHSPFMVNRLKPNSVRVVEKDSKKGTIVNNKSYSANWRPLRTSLGMVLSDSFYFADKTLVVEGVEDQIYLTALINYLYKNNIYPNIDANLLSIISSGGASEMPSVTRIVIDEKRPVAALIDGDRPIDYTRLSMFTELTEGDGLKMISDFGPKNAVTIQDLLPKSLYEEAVNNYIQKLVDDKVLKTLAKSKRFGLVAQSKSDSKVEDFLKKEYDVEEVSKVGIAREFENILDGNRYKTSDFKKCVDLIGWVITTLQLSSEKS
jgi:predicted ATP-dependent endonuclease of OLD family